MIPLSPLFIDVGEGFLTAPPESPEGMQLLQVTSRQITFSWTAPSSGNSPITGYIIVYNLSRSKWFLIYSLDVGYKVHPLYLNVKRWQVFMGHLFELLEPSFLFTFCP